MMAVAKAIGATWSVEVDGKDHGMSTLIAIGALAR